MTRAAMMNSTVRRGAVVVLLMLSAACEKSWPTPPVGTGEPYDEPAPPPAYVPPLSGPSRTFVFAHGPFYPVNGFTKQSRFVLYDSRAFVLQYVGLGEIRGGYFDANGVIAFDFGSGLGGATGSLNGDSLTVRYGERMQHSDFDDAVYVLVR